MKKIILPILVGASVLMMPLSAMANSHVYNASDTDVYVFWTAFGCAGLKSDFAQGGDSINLVCQKKKLSPGESSDYHYKEGTSGRIIIVSHKDAAGNYEKQKASTGNKGSSKRCAAIIKSGQEFRMKCGYSQKEYDALKAAVE